MTIRRKEKQKGKGNTIFNQAKKLTMTVVIMMIMMTMTAASYCGILIFRQTMSHKPEYPMPFLLMQKRKKIEWWTLPYHSSEE